MMAGILSVGVQKDGGSYPARTLYLHDLSINSLSSEGGLDKKAPSLGKLQFGYWDQLALLLWNSVLSPGCWNRAPGK